METQNIITAKMVAEEDRIDFFPKHCGRAFLMFESHVYNWMRRLCPDYDGVFWQFYELSNGGFYMAPETAMPVRIVCEGNYFNEEMSADAAGIVVTLFTLSHMAERVLSLADRYYDLMEYIDCHPEAGKIYAAID